MQSFLPSSLFGPMVQWVGVWTPAEAGARDLRRRLQAVGKLGVERPGHVDGLDVARHHVLDLGHHLGMERVLRLGPGGHRQVDVVRLDAGEDRRQGGVEIGFVVGGRGDRSGRFVVEFNRLRRGEEAQERLGRRQVRRRRVDRAGPARAPLSGSCRRLRDRGPA